MHLCNVVDHRRVRAHSQVRSYFLSAPVPLDKAKMLPAYQQKAIKTFKDDRELHVKANRAQLVADEMAATSGQYKKKELQERVLSRHKAELRIQV